MGVGVGKRFTNKWEETAKKKQERVYADILVLITSGRQANRIMELIFFVDQFRKLQILK